MLRATFPCRLALGLIILFMNTSTVCTFFENYGQMCKIKLTINTLLAQHWWLRVFGSQAGGMWRADLLRAGSAAAVIHFRLVNVRQKALVAVFI